MPKKKKADEVIIGEFYTNDDPAGLVAYYFREHDRIEKEHAEGKLDYNFFESEFREKFGIIMTLYTLGTGEEINESVHIKRKEFVKKVAAIAEMHFEEAVLDTGVMYDEVRLKVENGEIEGTEGYVGDAGFADKISPSIAEYNTASGIMKRDHRMLVTGMLMLGDNENKNKTNAEIEQDIREVAAAEANSISMAKANYRGMDNNQKEKYNNALFAFSAESVQSHSSINANTGEDFVINSFKMNMAKDLSFKFKNKPEAVDVIQKLDDNGLKEMKEKLKKASSLLKTFEESVSDWAKKAGELKDELEHNSTDEEKESDQYKKLHDALDNATRLGKNFSYISGERTYTAKWHEPAATNYSFNEVMRAAEGYHKKEFGKKVASYANESKEKTDKALSDGAADIYQNRLGAKNLIYEDLQSKVLDRDIKLIEAEQKKRIINSDKAGKARIDTLNGEIDKMNDNLDNAICFKIQARTSLLFVKSAGDFLADDKEKRNFKSEKDKKKHSSYLNLVEKAKALDNLDYNMESPASLLKKMEEAKKAADHYVKTHAGWKHLGSGWKDDGFNRIDKAKNISKNLDREINILKEKAHELCPEMKPEDTFGSLAEKMQERKTNIRKEIEDKKQEILSAAAQKQAAENKDGGIAAGQKIAPAAAQRQEDKIIEKVNLDDELKKARQTIQESVDKNHGQLDKDECMDALSRIATITVIRQQEKSDGQSMDMTNSRFEEENTTMKESLAFKRIVKSSTPLRLYGRVNENMGLWINDLNQVTKIIELENMKKDDIEEKNKNLSLQSNNNKKVSVGQLEQVRNKGGF